MANLIQRALLRCSRCSGVLRTTIPLRSDVNHPQPTFGSGLTPVSYLSTSPLTLPWTVNRYNSVRVNLTEAVAQGWKLKYLEDFPPMINSRLQDVQGSAYCTRRYISGTLYFIFGNLLICELNIGNEGPGHGQIKISYRSAKFKICFF